MYKLEKGVFDKPYKLRLIEPRNFRIVSTEYIDEKDIHKKMKELVYSWDRIANRPGVLEDWLSSEASPMTHLDGDYGGWRMSREQSAANAVN